MQLISTPNGGKPTTFTFDYPFRFGEYVCSKNSSTQNTAERQFISADVSSDAQFFVATAVLSILYCIFIAAVYAVMDELYTSKPEIPLAVSYSVHGWPI